MNKNDQRVLVYGLGSSGWGPLYPAHQSSLYAALVISHVYDSLVGVDNTGGFVPNLATTWDVNQDYTVYTFVLDTDRKFSDGTPLTANLYKESLLYSLKLNAAAANKSALDVLYALKGFSKFEAIGDIEGLQVEGDKILKLIFEKPYRGAIEQLSGTRYGAYIMKDGNYLGAGPYIYSKLEADYVELEPNPYYPHPLSIKKVKITTDGVKELYEGKVDVILAPSFLKKPSVVKINTAYKKLSFLLSAHRLVVVNGIKGKIFEKPEYRKAVQYIIFKYFLDTYADKLSSDFFKADLQFYPALFAGRLEKTEVMALMEEGKKYVESLRKASKTNPIKCVYRLIGDFNYCEALNSYNIDTENLMESFTGIKEIL
ncbi:MAG: hypothetical protein KKE11_03615, partial [Gammaproteobacteria bacterium]|nr:hypothetical protein [Gammaproteobacteria bacterium]